MLEYQLKPSLLLLRFNLGLYFLSIIVLLVHYPISYITVLLFLLSILLITHEWVIYRKINGQSPESLSINISSSVIEWQINNNIHQFAAYSVYTCRWGIILVLKQSKFRKSMILLADRFKNHHEYLDLRFHLIRLNQAIHAS